MKYTDIKDIKETAGIYYIKNVVNDKYYIGQSIRVKKRLLHHINNYMHDRYDAPIYRAFKKYGLDNFEFCILDTFEGNDYKTIKKELDILENKYIKEYNSYGPTGYNQTYGGDAGVLGYKFTDEQKVKAVNNVKKTQNDGRNKVYCYDVITGYTYTAVSQVILWKDILKEGDFRTNWRNLLIKKRYILGRTKDELKERIEKYKNRGNYFYTNKPKFEENSEAVDDIIKGISEKEWCKKHNSCRKTYYNYKKKLLFYF